MFVNSNLNSKCIEGDLYRLYISFLERFVCFKSYNNSLSLFRFLSLFVVEFSCFLLAWFEFSDATSVCPPVFSAPSVRRLAVVAVPARSLFLAFCEHNDEKIHEADNKKANPNCATYISPSKLCCCSCRCSMHHHRHNQTLVDSKSRLLRLTSSLISILRNICC